MSQPYQNRTEPPPNTHNGASVGNLRAVTHPSSGRLMIGNDPHVMFALLPPPGVLPAIGRMDIHQIGAQIGEAWWTHGHYHLRFDDVNGPLTRAVHCFAETAPGNASMFHLIQLKD